MKRSAQDDHQLFRVAELFLAGEKAADIAHKINEQQQPKPPLTRESIYPLLVKARDAGFIRLVPPLETSLAGELADKFKCELGSLLVVNVDGRHSGDHVAAAAAELVLGFIKEIAHHSRRCVSLGLGPGRATLGFSKHLSAMVHSDPDVFKLRLVAIGAGCSAYHSGYASISFFNLFPPGVIEQSIGMFAGTLIAASEFTDEFKKRSGICEAFDVKDQIDIVVNSMGDIDDEHDLLRTFLEQSGVKIEEFKKSGCRGNVQYRPYSDEGPIHEQGKELRAVTLYELEDFVRMAETKRKHVVLIAR
jgi:DNA-binding transcriptional regulator LsrR (DeoR family)